MLLESSSIEIFSTNLTLNHYVWAFSLDVLEKSRSSHMLAVLVVANVTPEFRAIVQSMLL
jgi:hypothetical protein